MAGFLSFVEPTRPMIDWPLLQTLRWERTRQIMAEEKLDAILTNVVDSVIYLTGWPKHRTSVHPGAYGVLFVRDEPEPVIFCSEGDSRASLSDRFYDDIRVLPPAQGQWVPIYTQAVADHGLAKARIGLDGRMTASLHNRLADALAGAELANASPVLDRIRQVKNPEEIKAYEVTVSLVETGINAIIRACKEGGGRYTEIEAGALGQYEMLRRGCNTTDLWVTSGPRAAPVRRYSTDRMIRSGELVVIDGPGSFNGFRSEFARTVWTGGPPSEDHKRIYRTVWQAHQAAQKILKPGTRTSDLEKACLEPVKEAGLEDHYGGYPFTGHGIGIRAEAFNVTARFKEMDVTLEEGMLLNLEPGIWWDGVGGVRVEDTYLVTKDGFRIISRAPYEDALLD